jgi:hypothetical protein
LDRKQRISGEKQERNKNLICVEVAKKILTEGTGKNGTGNKEESKPAKNESRVCDIKIGFNPDDKKFELNSQSTTT